MPADVTPTPYSTSRILPLSDDTVEGRYAQITPLNTTAYAASVNQTGEAMFGRPIIYTQSYTLTGVALSTYTVFGGANSQTYTVSTVRSSAPVLLVSVTQYHQVVATNTTVWNTNNSPSSLLLALAGSGDDVVSYKVAVVADTVV